jgi:hypothetical protein
MHSQILIWVLELTLLVAMMAVFITTCQIVFPDHSFLATVSWNG